MSTRTPVTDPQHDRPEPAVHTPGPWSIRHSISTDCWWILAGDKEQTPAFAEVFEYIENAEANARLMAAAPALLESMRELLNAAKNENPRLIAGTREYYTRIGLAVSHAENAIAKATGQVPA